MPQVSPSVLVVCICIRTEEASCGKTFSLINILNCTCLFPQQECSVVIQLYEFAGNVCVTVAHSEMVYLVLLLHQKIFSGVSLVLAALYVEDIHNLH